MEACIVHPESCKVICLVDTHEEALKMVAGTNCLAYPMTEKVVARYGNQIAALKARANDKLSGGEAVRSTGMFCHACGNPVCHERHDPQEPPEAEYDEGLAYCPDCWDWSNDRPRQNAGMKGASFERPSPSICYPEDRT